MSPHLAIDASGLVKRFGATTALHGIDLRVPAGSVYGLLGPNGAGKTTTVRILATLLRPDAGEARVLGHDVVRDAAAVRARLSLTGQFASVDQDLTGRENLMMLGRLLGLSRRAARERAQQLLEAFGLAALADRCARTYSGGLRRRLDIAASVVVTPDLLFLDEPTTGLDPQSRNQVWEIVRMLAADGTTVLLTTQYLDEADKLSDRIAVFDGGRLIAEGTTAALKASVGSATLRVRLARAEQRTAAEATLTRALGVAVHPDGGRGDLSASASDPGLAGRALAALAGDGIEVADFTFGRASLDEVFLSLTGRPPAAATGDEEEAAA